VSRRALDVRLRSRQLVTTARLVRA